MELTIKTPPELDSLMEKELELVKIEAKVSPPSPNGQQIEPPKDLREFYNNIIAYAIKFQLLQRKQKDLENEKRITLQQEARSLDEINIEALAK